MNKKLLHLFNLLSLTQVVNLIGFVKAKRATLALIDCIAYGGNADGKSISFDDDYYYDDFNPFNDIVFILYNPTHPNGTDISSRDKPTLAPMLDPNVPIKFSIHGFTDSSDGAAVQRIKDAYLANKNKNNIIAVDWSRGSGTYTVEYPKVVLRVPPVAERLGSFMQFLVEDLKINERKITIIGHSLGGQIAGLALFGSNSIDDRLDFDDATHVQVIHTAAGCLGFDLDIGRLDFYPNYKKDTHKMPGCGLDLGWHCSHARAPEYFAESINSDIGFIGWRCPMLEDLQKGHCPDTAYFAYMGGEPLDTEGYTGVYLLYTGSEPPYARPIDFRQVE